ncbi:hypothetical protein M0R19_07740 [Candidatus Pacearchaeota archaeon]|jgi:hypothetical protein|nr:hypothetical protein [Candidatus Pacearchaeota archaeon]
MDIKKIKRSDFEKLGIKCKPNYIIACENCNKVKYIEISDDGRHILCNCVSNYRRQFWTGDDCTSIWSQKCPDFQFYPLFKIKIIKS